MWTLRYRHEGAVWSHVSQEHAEEHARHGVRDQERLRAEAIMACRKPALRHTWPLQLHIWVFVNYDVAAR